MAMDPSTLPSRKKKEGVTRPSPGSPAILVSCPPQLQVKLGMLEYLKEEGQLKGAPGRSSSMVERALCDNAVWGISTLQSVTSHLCVVGEPSQLVGSLAWTIVESYSCLPLMPYLESINSCSCRVPPLKNWPSTSISFPFRTVAQRWKVVEASYCQLIIVVLGPMRVSKALVPTSLFLVTRKRQTAALPFLMGRQERLERWLRG